jgi:hypothetical protein
MHAETHISKNHIEGSLRETRLGELLEPCGRLLLTGAIRVKTARGTGLVTLRAGAVDEARFAGLRGDAALTEMKQLEDGAYELVQRMPDLRGQLARSAALEGAVPAVPLATIMRHCEHNALTCSVIVVSGFDRGEIVYRAGDIAAVALNGTYDPEHIVTILGWQDARFRVTAPPLDPSIAGWPKVSREPTAPFRLDHIVGSRGRREPPARAPAELSGLGFGLYLTALAAVLVCLRALTGFILR